MPRGTMQLVMGKNYQADRQRSVSKGAVTKCGTKVIPRVMLARTEWYANG